MLKIKKDAVRIKWLERDHKNYSYGYVLAWFSSDENPEEDRVLAVDVFSGDVCRVKIINFVVIDHIPESGE